MVFCSPPATGCISSSYGHFSWPTCELGGGHRCGDGQLEPAEIKSFLETLNSRYYMVIDAKNYGCYANAGRFAANEFYNAYASLIYGRHIPDLTLGFRILRARLILQCLYLLPNVFSYPTTITKAFLRRRYPVAFATTSARKRTCENHIRPFRDEVRPCEVFLNIATLYAPLKIFLAASALFCLTGQGYYAFSFLASSRFTNMDMLLFNAAVVAFLIGLSSEQTAALTFSKS